MSKTETIAALNDQLRTGSHNSDLGGIAFSFAASNASEYIRLKLLQCVKLYDDFTPDNNPHEERDMGFFEFNQTRYIWKIDYYADSKCEYGSEDASTTETCFRVLVIMEANEY